MLFVLVCLLYVLSSVLLFIGLTTFALICDCVMGVVMMAVLMWAFIRYSGRYRSVGGAIDQAAGVVLEQVHSLWPVEEVCSCKPVSSHYQLVGNCHCCRAVGIPHQLPEITTQQPSFPKHVEGGSGTKHNQCCKLMPNVMGENCNQNRG